MREVQLAHAKANLSALVDGAVRGESAIITRHGRPEAVIVPYDEWQNSKDMPSLGEWLMSAPHEIELPPRDHGPIIPPDFSE